MSVCLPLIDKDCQERKEMEAQSDLLLSQAVLTTAQTRASTPTSGSNKGVVIGLVVGLLVVGAIIFIIIKNKKK